MITLGTVLVPADKANQHRIAGSAVLNDRHRLVTDLECTVGVVDGRSRTRRSIQPGAYDRDPGPDTLTDFVRHCLSKSKPGVS